jgi:hypothetical protein
MAWCLIKYSDRFTFTLLEGLICVWRLHGVERCAWTLIQIRMLPCYTTQTQRFVIRQIEMLTEIGKYRQIYTVVCTFTAKQMHNVK